MSLGLVDLVGEEDLRSEMIRELGLTLGTESWLRPGINWIVVVVVVLLHC